MNMTLEGLVISLIEKFGDDGNKDEMKAELRSWMTSRLAVDCFDIREINRRYPELAQYLYGIDWITELETDAKRLAEEQKINAREMRRGKRPFQRG